MIPAIRPDSSVILVALEDEMPAAVAAPWRVVHTGVGKVNAALAAARVLAEEAPAHLINFGTAGALAEGMSGIVEVGRVFQRDMDVRALGFDIGQTPFDTDHFIDLHTKGVSCGTGDQFVTALPALATDLVDMEAFAIAKACKRAGVPMHCWKFVSDKADDGAARDWTETLHQGAELFREMVLDRLG